MREAPPSNPTGVNRRASPVSTDQIEGLVRDGRWHNFCLETSPLEAQFFRFARITRQQVVGLPHLHYDRTDWNRRLRLVRPSLGLHRAEHMNLV